MVLCLFFTPVMCWRPVTAGTGFSPPVVKKTDGLMDSNQLNKMSYPCTVVHSSSDYLLWGTLAGYILFLNHFLQVFIMLFSQLNV